MLLCSIQTLIISKIELKRKSKFKETKNLSKHLDLQIKKKSNEIKISERKLSKKVFIILFLNLYIRIDYKLYLL